MLGRELTIAVGVPIGIETALFSPPQAPGGEVAVTGMTLRSALNAMVALDRRYEWREMDGVIVFRPTEAWTDSGSLFYAEVKNIKLVDVPFGEAVSFLTRVLGNPNHPVTWVYQTAQPDDVRRTGLAHELFFHFKSSGIGIPVR